MQALEFTKVSKHFGGRRALEDVSFGLSRGTSLGLLGPNGSGKTTAVRLMLDLARPSDGSIQVQGVPPGDPESRRSLGYLPERLRLPPKTSVRAFLELQARLAGVEAGSVAREVEAVSELTGVEDRLRERLGELSKGLAQRVGFAQALVGGPELLILDEPNSGLDPIGMRQARDWIAAARERGCSVLVCSHVLSEIERVCDRVAILDRGRIVAQGELEEVLRPGESLEDAFVRVVGAS